MATETAPSSSVLQENDTLLIEYESAIVYAFHYSGATMNDKAAQARKQQAETYCLQRKADINTNWQYALRLFQLSRYEQVKFYALQVIQVPPVTSIDLERI